MKTTLERLRKLGPAKLIFWLLLLIQIPFQVHCLVKVAMGVQPKPVTNAAHLLMLQPSAFVFDRDPLFSRLTFEVQTKNQETALTVPYRSGSESFHSFIDFVLFRRILVSFKDEAQHRKLLNYFVCHNHIKAVQNVDVVAIKEILEVGEAPYTRIERYVDCN